MRKTPVRLVALVAAIFTALSATLLPSTASLTPPAALAAAPLAWQHRGFSEAVWDANALLTADASLRQLASTGANSVTFVVTWYQPSQFSNTISATSSTASDASLIHALDVAHGLGLQVNLKPQVDSQDGLWRAYLQPTDAAAWF